MRYHMNHLYHRRRALGVLVIIPALFSLGGCFTYHRAPDQGSPLAPVSLAPDAWPSFDTAPLEPLVETPKALQRYHIENERQVPSFWPVKSDRRLSTYQDWNTDDLLISHLDEHGLIRVWRGRLQEPLNAIPDATEDKSKRFDRNASYLTGPIALWEQELDRIEQEIGQKKPVISLRYGFPGAKSTGIEEQWQLNHGLELAIPEFIPEDPAGLIIHITGLMETKYEQALTNRLKAHGYAAAYIESDIFLDGPNKRAQRIRKAQRSHRRDELKEEHAEEDPYNLVEDEYRLPTKAEDQAYQAFYQKIDDQAEEEFPRIEDGFQIYPDTDLAALGQTIATDVDARVAEHAYAAQAIVWASDERFPVLIDKPIIVLGELKILSLVRINLVLFV